MQNAEKDGLLDNTEKVDEDDIAKNVAKRVSALNVKEQQTDNKSKKALEKQLA